MGSNSWSSEFLSALGVLILMFCIAPGSSSLPSVCLMSGSSILGVAGELTGVLSVLGADADGAGVAEVVGDGISGGAGVVGADPADSGEVDLCVLDLVILAAGGSGTGAGGWRHNIPSAVVTRVV